MLLVRVEEPIVSSAKLEGLSGKKLLRVEILTSRSHGLQGTGRRLVCLDAVGAGPGELALAVLGSSARMPEEMKDAPTDAVIVGLIDSIQAEGVRQGLSEEED